MKAFLQRWLIMTLAVLVAAHIVKGIYYDSITALLVASLVLGVLNAILRPLLMLLSLPLLILTLGLFTLVINAAMVGLVGIMVKGFHVESFQAAFFGGLIVSLVSAGVNLLFGKEQRRIEVHRGKGGPGAPSDMGGGPVIDV